MRKKRAQNWMHSYRGKLRILTKNFADAILAQHMAVVECRKHTNWKVLGLCRVERKHAKNRDDQDDKGQGQ
eukprot:16434554-Heterocapsa_arctica.AAC.1